MPSDNDGRLSRDEQWDIAKKAAPVITKPLSLAGTIGKAGFVVAQGFMDAMKFAITPLDYIARGIFAVRDFFAAWGDNIAAQRKTKMGAALFIALACGAYVSLGLIIALKLAVATA